MIVAKSEPLHEVSEMAVTPEGQAKSLADQEEFRRNIEWFGARAKEIRDAHSGKCICVAGQELFVGDQPREVYARALEAHGPLAGGFLTMYLSKLRGPRIYAS